jgi:hypothetical protein
VAGDRRGRGEYMSGEPKKGHYEPALVELVAGE